MTEKKEQTSKLYYSKKSSPRLTIPLALAQSLGWDHLEELRLEVMSLEGRVGIFVSSLPMRKKKQGKEVKKQGRESEFL